MVISSSLSSRLIGSLKEAIFDFEIFLDVPSESEIQALVSMGFDAERVRRALIHHRGNVTAACEQLISGN